MAVGNVVQRRGYIDMVRPEHTVLYGECLLVGCQRFVRPLQHCQTGTSVHQRRSVGGTLLTVFPADDLRGTIGCLQSFAVVSLTEIRCCNVRQQLGIIRCQTQRFLLHTQRTAVVAYTRIAQRQVVLYGCIRRVLLQQAVVNAYRLLVIAVQTIATRHLTLYLFLRCRLTELVQYGLQTLERLIVFASVLLSARTFHPARGNVMIRRTNIRVIDQLQRIHRHSLTRQLQGSLALALTISRRGLCKQPLGSGRIRLTDDRVAHYLYALLHGHTDLALQISAVVFQLGQLWCRIAFQTFGKSYRVFCCC